jgi:sialate O-acetylesterase
VQLAQFAEGGNPDNIEYALLREQQFRAAQQDERVYLASLHDVYVPEEMHQVHSSKKRIVGLRLGSMALGNTYELAGYPREVLTYSSCKVEGDKMQLTFDNWAKVGGWGSLVIKGMEISGADGVWHPAQVQVDGYTPTMTVWSPEVKAPVAVRYGFRNFSECTLSGANGLGAYPFRTDDEDLK